MLSICSRKAFSPMLPVLLSTLFVIFTLALPHAAQAHRVNIFAWTEGDQVVAECGFNGGNKVKQGQVVVYDAATGAKLQEGRTDDQGVYRFPVPAEGKAHGLRIVVKAGEGHQNEWMMDAAELAAIQTPTTPARAAETKDSAQAAEKTSPATQAVSTATPGAKGAAAPTPSAVGVSSGELQTIVNAALDAKLGPIRRELAEMRVSRPGFSEIFGGIGWLVGLAGIALYFKGRRG
ncbi:MAG TPA: cobalamin biosynthesis protein CbiL [Desulfovibrio sp.]|uniref:cobalamin biosynthesis protein CbiL n=1 Tax=Desulfovibrio sp. TaxID=885 RepID=UPI002D751219|nr:cobalamin biosynthesis protein CbiL [Desulfovibrio sp.]HZF61332.1 cobalamin biosynthesis protein CbiL [Desulfovibrio sp.]